MAATAGLAMLAGRAHAEADATQPRSLPAFHAIDIVGVMEIEVSVGKAQSVQLVGDQDMFDKVLTSVKDGTLVVDTKFEHHGGNHRMKMVVSVPDVSALTVEGTGSMVVSGVANNNLAITLPGTGEVKVEGTTGTLKVDVGGTGSISARKLTAKVATVNVAGTGSASLVATDTVDLVVSGTGSISVGGHPAHVHKRVTGMGSIGVH
ncbi:MAG TPA: head GIN domain-containing protein [Kofleriaceae bacterium]|nr:head GIN domain-containing protein [Kofleriaceae bacterium]